MIRKPVDISLTTESSSTPGKVYTTLRYTDGSTSCNCPGWTRRVAGDGSRSCKHTERIEKMRSGAKSAAEKLRAKAAQVAEKVRRTEQAAINAAAATRTLRDAFEAVAPKPKPTAPRPRPVDTPRRRYFAEDE